MKPPAPPEEWPKEVSDLYSPVRVIGKGGFASVWMAEKKGEKSGAVAIKVMRGDDGYAQREVAILSELTSKYPHPNIIRLLHGQAARDGVSYACAVLSLARGPTLNYVLNRFGALGLVVAQSVSNQLVDAVAFLHGHAVLHRDIQPCNLIVSGAMMNDDLWWSDGPSDQVMAMARNCRITLVDFGFARALGPDDVKSDVGLKKVLDEGKDGPAPTIGTDGDPSSVDQPLTDASLIDTSRGRSRTRDNLDASISHETVRDLSALGHRSYAAPEILSGIRNFAETLNDSLHGRKPRKSLGACVSSYGMVADAFSVGATIRHMVTGVPPNVDVEEFLAGKNRPVKKMWRKIRKSVVKDDGKRAKRYRAGAELPEEVSDLIKVLTHYNPWKRATVRSASGHPWFKASAAHLSPGRGKEVEHGGPIVYLKCGGE